MTPARIAELRALADKASDGPWTPFQPRDDEPFWDVLSGAGYRVVDANGVGENNADFIAASRTALPEALDEIERLRAALTKAADDLESAVSYVPEYFQDKWEMADDIKAARAALGKP